MGSPAYRVSVFLREGSMILYNNDVNDTTRPPITDRGIIFSLDGGKRLHIFWESSGADTSILIGPFFEDWSADGLTCRVEMW